VAGALLFTGVGAFPALVPWTLTRIVQIGLMLYLIQKIGRTNSSDHFEKLYFFKLSPKLSGYKMKKLRRWRNY
jgi:hypothetical protein